VRITFLVRELVMLTMDCDPQEGPSFQSRHAANRKKILKPLGGGVRAMGEQPVITHAKSQAARHPVQEGRDEQRTPTEEEKRRHSANVKQHQDGRDGPVQPIPVGLIAGRTHQWQRARRYHGFFLMARGRRFKEV
jgi:hypothetical protein